MEAKLPNFLIIGAMKCGTTSLHNYLDLHPDISMAPGKELNFFARQGNWDKGVGWYESQLGNGALVRGESSPSYTFYPFARGVPERAAELIPDAKLIYMVRDPIDRIVSHYVHRVAAGRETRSLGQVVETLEQELASDPPEPDVLWATPGYLSRSLYHLQISRWCERFPASSIMVIDQQQLQADRSKVLGSVFAFLGVDDSFASADFDTRFNSSEGKRLVSPFGARVRATRAASLARFAPPFVRRQAARAFVRAFDHKVERPALTAAERDRVRELLAADVERLRAFTGQEFREWAV
jgi:Sulfotransferase domain